MARQKRKIWDVVSAVAEAKEYTARGKFGELSPGAYAFLKKHEMLVDACSHMDPVHNDYTKASVLSEAKKYQTRSDFISNFAGGCAHAKRHGYYEEACAHMVVKRRKWTVKSVTAEALKYKTKGEFLAECGAAYSFSHRRGLLDAVCAHMPDHIGNKWDFDSVLAVAKQYDCRSSFMMFDQGAYQHARRAGFLNDVCAHMEMRWCGFDLKKPAVLYCILLTRPNGGQLYKIGITNRSASSRLSGLVVQQGVSATILREIPFATGLEARAKEKELHATLARFRYQGEPIMGNGNTELFSRDATNYL